MPRLWRSVVHMNRIAPASAASAAASSTFERFAERDEFAGFGYIGGRRIALNGSDPECPAQPELVAQTDERLVDLASVRGWTEDELFAWANSRLGRWFADAVFGGGTFAQALKWNLFTKVD